MADARVERQPGPARPPSRIHAAHGLVLVELAPVRLQLRLAELGRVGAEEELEQREVAQLGELVGGSLAPFLECTLALGRERIAPPPPPALLAALLQIAGLGEAL